MLGGRSRRGEGLLVIKNSNVFAALDTHKKKKTTTTKNTTTTTESDNKKSSSSSSSCSTAPTEVFWAPIPVTKSWADLCEEDDDDFYATTAPPVPVWASSAKHNPESATLPEDTESEGEIFGDDSDGEVEEEQQEKAPEIAHVPSKEGEKQVSKKERKIKEHAELDAILADLGINPKQPSGAVPELNGHVEKKPIAASKNSKKKKKKDKSSKEAKEQQDETKDSEVTNGNGDVSPAEVKERLKTMASVKKKKSSKPLDSAVKAAAREAAARSSKLAAAKKKEKIHHNQQRMY